MVMLVVFLFLRRTAPTLAAGVTVPLSLAGTCAAMWVAGFSIDNLSLMALAVSVGFVVDDAIVMIENVFRNLEQGKSPLRATIEGAKQIGFTVVSISISLCAAFIPLLFMGGVVGRLFREFSVTLIFAIAISTVVSLTVTPMICAHFVKEGPSPDGTWFDRLVEAGLRRMIAFYGATLDIVLRHRGLTLLVFLGTIVLTVVLYIQAPKGYFPQDDTGLIFGGTRASPDISFEAMKELQQRATDIVLSDPAVKAVGSSVGASTFNASVNNGRLFISLKPLAERKISAQQFINRMRPKLLDVGGMRVFMFPAQDVRAGGRQSSSSYQFTLWDANLDELLEIVPRVNAKVQTLPELTDVTTDREQGGLQANVIIDRAAAAQNGVKIQDIDNALNNAFSQRQVSTIYSERNQYRVILEIDPKFQRDPSDLTRVFVAGNGSAQVPMSAVARVEKGLSPLVINHQGQYPAVTITYNLAPNVSRWRPRRRRSRRRSPNCICPTRCTPRRPATCSSSGSTSSAQPLVIVAALLAIYIILGVLYESLAHPLTIISTLPSAGVGALLALAVFNAELTVIAFIGIILLIGIVKKNGIMMVDFALSAERERGLPPAEAIREACLERFRPILMTTLAAMLGALPLVIATGPGSELRRPLGMTIIGGLLVSQVLTLYTTPVIYLILDKLHRRLGGRGPIQLIDETRYRGRPATS